MIINLILNKTELKNNNLIKSEVKRAALSTEFHILNKISLYLKVKQYQFNKIVYFKLKIL